MGRLVASLPFLLFHIMQAQEVPDSVVTSSRQFGYLRVLTNLDSFYVLVDNDLVQKTLLSSKDSIQLPAGSRRITLISQRTSDLTFKVKILPDTLLEQRVTFAGLPSTRVLERTSSYPRIRWQSNLIVLTDEDAEIYFENEKKGRGMAMIDSPSGKYVLTVADSLGRTSEAVVNLTEGSVALIGLYTRPSRIWARALLPIPGATQVYKGEVTKGLLLFLGTSITAYVLLRFDKRLRSLSGEYDDLTRKYKNAVSEVEAKELGDRMESRYPLMKTQLSLRNVAFGTLITFIGYHLYDALLDPEGGYRKSKTFDLFGLSGPVRGGSVEIGMRVNLTF